MLSLSRQQIVIFCAAAAMVGGFFLLRYLPLQKKFKAVEQMRISQQRTIEEISAKSKQMPVSKEQLFQLQNKVGNYQAAVPQQRQLGSFLDTVTDLMNENNLKEALVWPDKEIELKEINCIPLNIQCKGGLVDIFDFYKQLQSMDRAVRIEQVTLVNDKNFKGELSMQAKAIIYYCRKAG
ncbi:MAG: type 4a pilus biogenesis protein PilO [Planctomycetes bacterium]|nr:type 4a pilus biogenesis protein PilO [Planctomycetota bacterium]